MTGWPFLPPLAHAPAPGVVYDCPQPGFDNVIIAQLRAEIAALKAKLARVSAFVPYARHKDGCAGDLAERCGCGFRQAHLSNLKDAQTPTLDTHVVTPETPDETTARMKADMDRRLDDPVVRASVCRPQRGSYKVATGVVLTAACPRIIALAERPTNTSERERVIAALLPKVGGIFHGQTGANVAGELADAAIAAMDRPTISASVVEGLELAAKYGEEATDQCAQAAAFIREHATITGGKDD